MRGFTLIEILIVIGIIAVLAAIVIVAINPARQFAQARNTQRWSGINAILNAVHQNIVDNKGSFNCSAGDIPTHALVYMNRDPGGFDICSCLVPTYLAEMPYDPNKSGASYVSCSSYSTAYQIQKDSTTSRITVKAPWAELSETIKVTR